MSFGMLQIMAGQVCTHAQVSLDRQTLKETGWTGQVQNLFLESAHAIRLQFTMRSLCVSF